MNSAATPTAAAPAGRAPRPTRGLARRSTETATVLRPILDLLSRGGARLFRNNVGSLPDRYGRPVAYGLGSEGARALPGTSDVIGWQQLTITPDMVGRTVAVFTAIEAKDQGRLTPAQRAFLHTVHTAGGIAGCARSLDDARAILDQGPWLPPIGV